MDYELPAGLLDASPLSDAQARYNSMTGHERALATPDDAIPAALERGEFAETDLMEVGESAPHDPAMLPREYIVVAAYNANGHIADYHPCELGLHAWHPLYPRMPLVFCRERLSLRGIETTHVRFELRVNEALIRRELAAELAPDVHAQFPQGPRRFADLQCVEWNQDAIAKAELWVKQIDRALKEGIGIGIRHGQTGCGKTALISVAALSAVNRRGVHALFVYAPDLFAGEYKRQEEQVVRAVTTDLLVLDDIDAAVKAAIAPNDPDSSRSRSVMLRILNERYNKRLPVLWSSNTRNDGGFVFHLGARCERRLLERTHVLRFGDGAWNWAAHLRSKEKQHEP